MNMPKPTPILFTKEGYNKLKEEYDGLKNKRPYYVSELSKAAEMGDRSENAAYKYAKQKLRSTDSRLRYLSHMLDRAKVVESTQQEYVEIGSEVTVSNGQKTVTFRIVGGNESDPAKGFLSYQSPLGNALMHKKVGEEAEISAPAGMVKYTIQSIG